MPQSQINKIYLLPLIFLFIFLLTSRERPAQDVHKAVRVNDPQEVQQLLSDGADVNALEIDEKTGFNTKSTPIIIAARKEYLEVVEVLIANGADVNAASIYGKTALAEAAIKGNNEIINLLLDAGAEVDAAKQWSKTPLMWAAAFGKADTVKLLLEAGADQELKNEEDLTALDFARESGHDDVVALLEQGNHQTGISYHSRSPLALGIVCVVAAISGIHRWI